MNPTPRTLPARCALLVLWLFLGSCAWFRPDPPVYPEVKLASGLVVRDLVVPESGAEVSNGAAVAIDYLLRLADKTVVESSRDSGQLLRFHVGDGTVPSGLDEGVLGMRLFGRRRLTVPPELAFGAQGRPPAIPASATVIFDIELMEHTPSP